MNTIDNIKNMTEKDCVVDLLLKDVKASECNSCGKCVYGYEGVFQIGSILNDITNKRGQSGDLERMKDLANLMLTQTITDPGKEIAEEVLYAIDNHEDEFVAHISKKGCKAGVCKKFLEYYILPEKCIGCGDCMDECDEDAIMGKKKFIHVIDQDECIQCGKCMEACDEDAIIIAGAVKPRVPKKPVPIKR